VQIYITFKNQRILTAVSRKDIDIWQQKDM